MTRRLVCALVGVAVVLSGAATLGQTFGLSRRIHHFDFEEHALNNYEQMPIGWYAIGRKADSPTTDFERFPLHAQMVHQQDFPAYTYVGFNQPQADKQVNHTLRLGLNGGSVGAFLEVGAIPAVPNSDYLINARVRTSELRFARAFVTAYFIDERGRRVEQSVAVTEPIATDGRWQTVSLKLVGDFEQAAWIGLEVTLLQPSHDPRHPLGRHQVVLQDVRGQAEFDDVTVWQLPHVAVQTQSRVNIIREPETPELSLEVRDLAGRPLVADVTLYDYEMNEVARRRQRVGAGAPAQFRWEPGLDAYGWYLVDLIVREPIRGDLDNLSEPIARTLSGFLYLPREQMLGPTAAQRFRVLAEGVTDSELLLLPELMDATHLGGVTISAWDEQTTLLNLDRRQRLLDEVIQPMMARGRRVAMSLYPVPNELASSIDIDVDNPLWMFTRDNDVWLPYLQPILIRHGQRVREWQLGALGQAEAFYYDKLPALLTQIETEFEYMAPAPRLVLPWLALQDRRTDAPDGTQYVIDMPAGVQPAHIGAYLAPWRDQPRGEFVVNLSLRSAAEMTQSRRVNDLVQRMVYGWGGEAGALSISRPWTPAPRRQASLIPDPVLGAFASVATRLADRWLVGRMPIGEGLECLIFDGPAGGMLVMWDIAAPRDQAKVSMFLGSSPVAIDCWGNRRDVPMVEGKHELQLTPTPIFVEGIDPELALFRAHFKINEPFIESVRQPHERIVTLTNPWPRTISGHLSFTEPSGWTIAPQRRFFSIAPGRTIEVPIEMTFPPAETAGPKRLAARFEFTAKQKYDVIVSAPMELGLRDIDFRASVVVERNPRTGELDAIVQQEITNVGDDDLSLYAFANMPGFPRQERVIARLRPGQLNLQRFRIPGAGEAVSEKSIRVGLRETSGPAILNKLIRPE